MVRKRTRPPHFLQIMQANVGKGGPAHEAALNLAYERDIDILLIQEPWIHRELSRRISKKHPAFNCFISIEKWDKQPRVLTYVRKHPQIRAYTVPGPWTANRDIHMLSIQAWGLQLQLINVYNAPPGSEDPGQGVSHLLAWTPPAIPSLLAGDLNLKHPAWQPGATPSTWAEPFLQWAVNTNLALTIEPGTPTRGPNMLDQAWATPELLAKGVDTQVARCLYTSSDHQTLLTKISLPRHISPLRSNTRFRLDTMDDKCFQQILEANTARLAQLSDLSAAPSPAQLDSLAQGITEVLMAAMEASTKRASGRGIGQPWWNQECRQALLALQQAQHRNPSSTGDARDSMRRTVRQAKQKYWHGKIAEVSGGKDIFGMIKWAHSTGCFHSPPLRDEAAGEVRTEPHKKQELLQQVLLQRAASKPDIPVSWTSCRSPACLPFPEVTTHEIQNSLLNTGNTTPGTDNVPATVLRKAWRHIQPPVEKLFRACLRIGWHPTPFREATLVVLPKPNRDPAIPRSYRLIALLSTLGKGLERLVARRLAWTAVQEKVLHPQHFGALPGRAATDLVAAAVHDIEESWARGRVVSLLTLDIKGAFDAVLPGRMVKRLQEQGWPANLIRWVESFMTGRTGKIRMDGMLGDLFSIPAGVPQGSPVSPILFMLFIQPMFFLGSLQRKRARSGYADDIALLCAGASLEENITTLQEDFKLLHTWADCEGLTFDIAKSELAHFSRRKNSSNPSIRLETGHQIHLLAATPRDRSIRYLGIWLDRKLGFRKHVETMAAKGRRVASGIQALSNTVRGAPVQLLRQAVQACVLTVLCYGAEAWWPGSTRIARGREVCNQVASHVNKLDLVLRDAIRGALPVYKTTPIPALHREIGIQPMKLALDHRRAAFAARIKRLDSRHPLARRCLRATRNLLYTTRLTRAASQVGATEPHNLLLTPPWARAARAEDTQVGFAGGTKEQAAQSFTGWLKKRNPLDLVAFTDGSQLVHPRRAAGAGWAICWGRDHPIIATGNLSLPRAEVFDAEAIAALHALQAATSSLQAKYASNIFICLDNLEVARSLGSSTNTSSQQIFTQFREAAEAWQHRERFSHTIPGKVIIRWVPGHAGVAGNEKADQEAKAAAAQAAGTVPQNDAPASLAYIRRQINEQAMQAFKGYWAQNAPRRYTELEIPLQKVPAEMKLPRFSLGKLYAARTGHGDFAAYHTRLNHEDAECHCQCGSLKSPEHFYYCRLARRSTTQRRRPAYNIREMLATPQGAQEFHSWLSETAFYRDICPMRKQVPQLTIPSQNPPPLSQPHPPSPPT
jgi:ribonuclease HI